MNLITDPWIPVLFENGDAKPVGLEQLYRDAETIRDLNVNPPQRIALMRLLLCITQAALDGPENEDDWKTCRERIIPESLDYLSTRNDKFELYGDAPFLQVKALKETNNAVIDKLDFGLAAGNNATLFDHEAIHDGREHSDAWKTLMLLTYQCFSPGGKIGQTEWAGSLSLPKNGTSEHSPCLESSPIHLILRGENLLQTIRLNLLTKRQVAELPNSSWGIPLWDRFPKNQTDESAVETVRSYLGRLVPLSRGILMEKEKRQMTLVNGLAYPKLPEGREPMLSVVMKGTGKQQRVGYVNLSLVRHIWRELGSLLCLRSTANGGGALSLKNCSALDVNETVDFWTGGLVADKGKILDTAEWNFTIPVSMLGDVEMKKYSDGVARAGAGEWGVKSAVKSYSKNLKSESGGYSRKATVHYWSTLDSSYQMLVDIASDKDRNLNDWRALLQTAMEAAFEQACPHETPRQIKAFVAAKKLLTIKEKKNG